MSNSIFFDTYYDWAGSLLALEEELPEPETLTAPTPQPEPWYTAINGYEEPFQEEEDVTDIVLDLEDNYEPWQFWSHMPDWGNKPSSSIINHDIHIRKKRRLEDKQ